MVDLNRQPLKGLYLVYAGLSLLTVRLPCWTLQALLPSWRPRPSWTLKRCINFNLLKYFMRISGKGIKLRNTPNHLALQLDNGVQGLWVEPVPNLIVGEVKQWAEDANVKPVRIPGYWLNKKGKEFTMGQRPGNTEKVAYFLHGGAYISLSAHPADPTAAISRGLLKYCTDIQRVFSIEYRLSTAPPLKADYAFPAALVDAIAGYNYLINVVGYTPSQIVVVGDSAGGNLAIALARYLIESDVPSLPSPGSLVLLSPWCDLSPVVVKPGSSFANCSRSDYIKLPTDGALGYATLALLGPLDASAAASNVYISPASLTLDSGRFKGFPRSFIVAGGAEVLLDQIRVLKERMEKDVGENNIAYHEAADSIHDFLAIVWQEPQRGETFRLIADWISAL